MSISGLLGATMVAGAGPSGGVRAAQSAVPAPHARRAKLLRRARERRDSPTALTARRPAAKVAR